VDISKFPHALEKISPIKNTYSEDFFLTEAGSEDFYVFLSIPERCAVFLTGPWVKKWAIIINLGPLFLAISCE
jgi:hypothetical protein